MTEILEYIMSNYTWFLFGAIIILLAIIGSYADKTNFGQGKTNNDLSDKKDKENILLENKEARLDDIYKKEISEQQESVTSDSKKEKQNSVEETSKTETAQKTNNSEKEIIDLESQMDSQDEAKSDVKPADKPNSNETVENKNEKLSFEQLDDIFNEVLPEKQLITNELLDEVDSLDIDNKSQKTDFNNMPSLDDFELPKIKNLKSTDDDIWKL